MNVSNAYTDNSLYWMRKKNGVNYQLTGGFRGELSSVTGPYSANRYMFYATPHLEWNRENILLTAALSAQWSHLPLSVPESFRVLPLHTHSPLENVSVRQYHPFYRKIG